MSGRRPQAPPARETRTLGDVLYANKGKARVPEEDWVRLVQSIAAGDQPALHSLYAQTHRMVFTLSLRIVGNRETAEELTVDVFHEVWRRASTYDPAGGSVVGWIMNQTRSRAIDRLRFEHRKKRAGNGTDAPMTATVDGPQEVFEADERAHVLREALRVLTPDERLVIETAFFSELTYSEAAQALNQPLGTVKTRIRAALAKLRQALSQGADSP